MQIKTGTQYCGFKPVALEIIFETEKELNTFGALFNFTPVSDTVDAAGIDSNAIRRAVEKIGGNCSGQEWLTVKDSIKGNIIR